MWKSYFQSLQMTQSNTTSAKYPEAVLPWPRVSASAARCCNSSLLARVRTRAQGLRAGPAQHLQRDSWPETCTLGNRGADMLLVQAPHGATFNGKVMI